MEKKICTECGGLLKRWAQAYCSNHCQARYQYKKYIEKWKSGSVNNGLGVSTKNISKHLKRYLLEMDGARCSLCGWNKRHPVTKVIPVEVDHMDGNSENNAEGNLRLLCPNCHALTPSFRNLNSGKGRIWRKGKQS